MRYIVCPADSFVVLDASTDKPARARNAETGEESDLVVTWADFVRIVFLEPDVLQGIDAADRAALRRELLGLTKGVYFGISDEAQWKVIADALKRPKLMPPAWHYCAEAFLEAFTQAPKKKPEAVEEPKAEAVS